MEGFLVLSYGRTGLELHERYQTVAIIFGNKNMYANSVDLEEGFRNSNSLPVRSKI